MPRISFAHCTYSFVHFPSHLANCPRLRSGTVCFASGCTSASLGDRTSASLGDRSTASLGDQVRRPSGVEVIISHEWSGPRAKPRGLTPSPSPEERGARQKCLIAASLQLARSSAFAVTSHSPLAVRHSPFVPNLPNTSLAKLSILENANHRLPRSLMEAPM